MRNPSTIHCVRLAIRLLSMTSVIALASACGEDTEQSASEITSENTVKLTLSFDPTSPTVGQNRLVIELADTDGRPVTSATLAVDPQMPHHGHGSTETPAITEKGDGRYEAFPVTFQMPGMWVTTVEATQGQMTGTDKITVTVK